jgi:hypothetical protein
MSELSASNGKLTSHQVGPVSLDLRTPGALVFGQAYNKKSLIDRLSIKTSDGSTIQNVTLEITVESLGDTFSKVWSRRLDSLGPLPRNFDDINIDIDVDAMFQLQDQRQGNIKVRISGDDTVVGEHLEPIAILAPNSWVFEQPLAKYAALLPAHVLPNDPSLRSVLDDSVSILSKLGVTPSWNGYQDNLRKVDAMVQAIYEGLQGRQITYVNPPASWDLDSNPDTAGQRVRTPTDVLTERAGTCLDTACLLAALFENVGIHPLLVIIPGHAFVGYWTDENLTPPSTTLSIEQVINLIDQGMIRVLETTTLCNNGQPFDSAISIANSLISRSLSELQRSMFVDVVHARRIDGIKPIPARLMREDGSIEIVEYKASELTISKLREALKDQAGTRAGLNSADVPARITTWKNSLLDLSLRNPLLNYKFPIASSIKFLVPKGAAATIEDLLQQGHEILLAPSGSDDPNNPRGTGTGIGHVDQDLLNLLATKKGLYVNTSEESYVNRFRRLRSNAKSILDQTGTNNLHIAIGMLVWEPEGKAQIHSPLLLVPVTLKPYNRARQFKLVIDDTSAITPNYSLVEKLKRDLNLELPKLENPDLDDSGVDVDGLISYVREELVKAELPFRIDESVTLGFFDFSTYRLWRDLNDNWPAFTKSPLVNHLVYTPNEPYLQDANEITEDLDQLASELPISTDGSQVTAVAKAMAGDTFVLQGPPGTGKSQTITNLIARSLISGKRLLFIAEKPAALNVVKDRIDSVGLGNFCLDLHDKGMRPAAVRQQLLNALEFNVSPDRTGYDISVGNHSKSVSQLSRYRERLHSQGRFAESAYSAHDASLAIGGAEDLTIDPEFLREGTPEAKKNASALFSEIEDAGAIAGTYTSNIWSFSCLDTDQLDQVDTASLRDVLNTLNQQVKSLDDLTEIKGLIQNLNSLESLQLISNLGVNGSPNSSQILNFRSASRTGKIEFLKSKLEEFDSALAQMPLPPAAIDFDFSAQLEKAMELNGGLPFGKKKKIAEIVSSCASVIAFTEESGADVIQRSLNLAIEIVSQALEIRVIALDVAAFEITSGVNCFDPSNLSLFKNQMEKLEEWLAYLNSGTSESTHLSTLLEKIQGESENLIANFASLASQVFATAKASDVSIGQWRGNETLGKKLLGTIPELNYDSLDGNLNRLTKWANLAGLANELRAMGLNAAVNDLLSGKVNYQLASESFEASFFKAIEQRQFDEQSLSVFDGQSHDRAIALFTKSRDELIRALPGVLAQDIATARGFDAGVNIGAVGELRREIGKTRGGKSIRALLSQHWDVISKITPVILTSPDSVARFIDAGLEQFDLVVFDEASQIRVAHAIGSIGRAKSAVIVGDSKQMPPTTNGELSMYSEDIEETDEYVVEDEESILTEATRALVPDIMLSWHYRSQDESLIAFSNAQYYDGKLSSFPSAFPADTSKGLTFVKVDGNFNRTGAAKDGSLRTNPVEARAIVDEIKRRVNDPELSKYSIGVVTFNLQQKALVESLLADCDDEAVQLALSPAEGEEIFVKNLESVQGDERDVILFSVAFSKNDKGVVPLQFGPLNRTGGQRRLNVAITRARRQNIIFCSFEPEELRSENSASEGLRHLRTFLEMAKYGPESAGFVTSAQVEQVDRHRAQVAEALRNAGLGVETEVGLSGFKVDIAIKHPTDPTQRILAITLDGPSWASRVIAGDRDSLPNALLTKKMRWLEVARIWLPTWVANQDAEIQRIKDLCETLVHEASLPTSVRSDGPEVHSPANDFLSQANSELLPENYAQDVAPKPEAASNTAPALETKALDPWADVPTWQPVPVQVIASKDDLDNFYVANQFVPKVAEVFVNQEAPISPTRLAKLVANAFGLQRVPETRVSNILAIIGEAFPRDAEGFYFRVGSEPNKVTGWRKSTNSTERKIEDISLIEIANACSSIAKLGMGISEEQLIRECGNVFAYSRITGPTIDRIKLAIQFGIRNDVLETKAEKLYAKTN